jgi:hypothetical protein
LLFHIPAEFFFTQHTLANLMTSTAAPPSISLPQLNERRDWQGWNKAVMEAAKAAHPSQYGIMQLLLPHPTFLLAINQPAHPPLVLPVPGPAPHYTPAGPYNAWKHATAALEAYQAAAKNLFIAMVNSMGPAVQSVVMHPEYGALRLDLPTLYLALHAELGQLLASDLRTARTKLESTHFHSGVDNMREFTAKHRLVHGIFITNLQPLGTEQTISMLRETLKPCGLFETCYDTFLTQFPLPANQTFANFERVLHQKADNMPLTTTTGSGGYAGLATSCAGCSCGACPGLTSLALSSRSSATPAAPAKAGLYCWSHGSSNHTSGGCLHQAPGHNVTATLSKKCNGNPHSAGTPEARAWLKSKLPTTTA